MDETVTKPTRERMIEATAILLQQRGYYGTSLSEILAASGAPRGSLYFHFPGGKDQIVLEATRMAVDETTREIYEVMAGSADPAKGVRIVIEAAAALMRESDYGFGCPVAPLILDSPAEHPELAALCREAFDTWVGLFREAFAKAGIPAPRAQALALLVEASLEGLLVVARAYRDTDALAAVAEELERAIASALPEAVRGS